MQVFSKEIRTTANGITKAQLQLDGYKEVRIRYDDTYNWIPLTDLPDGLVKLRWENQFGKSGLTSDIIARKRLYWEGKIVGSTKPLKGGDLVVKLLRPIPYLPKKYTHHQTGWVEQSSTAVIHPIPTKGHLTPQGWVWEG